MTIQARAHPRIVIIGGGITGLAAGWAVQQEAAGKADYTLIEASERWGGKVQTEATPAPGGEFVIDAGPESFVTRKPELWDLAGSLGLGEAVVNPGAETAGMAVLHGGRPVAVPLHPVKFARSPLLTPRGKLRLLAEPLAPVRREPGDESLAAFATRRLGREAMENLVGPILAGIYNTDPERQSLLATAPVMREMELQYGSLVRAVIAKALAGRRRQAGPKPPRFFTFARGAQTVVDALVQALTGRLLAGRPAQRLTPRDEGGYWVEAGAERLPADAVILATPANVAARLLREAAPEAAEGLAQIGYGHIGTISLAYADGAEIARLGLRGLMIPRREGRAIDAVTFTSLKTPGRAPEGMALVRVFFGAGRPETAELSDTKLVAVVEAELRALLGMTQTPNQAWAYRWLSGFPQAAVGHLDRVKAIEAALPRGVYLAGSAYDGIGVPDCIRQGTAAARQALSTAAAIGRGAASPLPAWQ
jgi:oxygen-dependent protoporphyrinogen oxidase